MHPALRGKEMFRNYFFLNIILILVVSFLGVRFYKAILYKKESPLNITIEKNEAGKNMADGVVEDQGFDRASLKIITDKDIFRSSRTSANDNSQMPLRNPPTLFGTVIAGSEKKALLKEDGGKSARMYRLRESVSGYLIVDILDDKVLLEAGGRTIEVKLRGKKSVNPQLTSGTPAQRPQEAGPRRRVRPSPQRPSRNGSNIQAPVPSAPVTQPVPAPAPPEPSPEPVPSPEPPDSMEEAPNDIQQ